MNGRPVKIINGTANTELARKIIKSYDDVTLVEVHKILDPRDQKLLMSGADTLVSAFSDGETRIEINENMRGCDVFVVQPTGPPVNESLMQLLLILDALKRSNCWRVTAVMPYFGYARQDKKLKPRVPISARAVANLIENAGVDRILTMDLHSNQIQGYFNCPVDNLFSSTIFLEEIGRNHLDTIKDVVVVSPDVGGAARAVHFAKRLNAGTAIIHKSRLNPNEIEEMRLLGDVYDAKVIIVDDMVDTAGTLCRASDLLLKAGADEIFVYAAHGIFSGEAIDRIQASNISRVYVTDSLENSKWRLNPAYQCDKITAISCADLFASAIRNIHMESSVSCLFT